MESQNIIEEVVSLLTGTAPSVAALQEVGGHGLIVTEVALYLLTQQYENLLIDSCFQCGVLVPDFA